MKLHKHMLAGIIKAIPQQEQPITMSMRRLRLVAFPWVIIGLVTMIIIDLPRKPIGAITIRGRRMAASISSGLITITTNITTQTPNSITKTSCKNNTRKQKPT